MEPGPNHPAGMERERNGTPNDRTRIRVPLLAICAVAAWASGCGDGATRPPPETLRAASVTVTPAAASLTAPDATVRLNARVRDGNGRAMAGVAVIWTSLDAAVATVAPLGLVAAAGNGTTTIVATAGAVSGTATVTVAVTGPDRAALAALHAAADGPNWADDENWLTDGPLREWRGVETDVFDRVVRLDLGGRQDGETGEWVSHGLRGPIPPELASLASLTLLNLSGNALEGPIPPELASLARLTSLNLRANALEGPVPPELGALARLEGLWLDANRLEGPIPAELGSLTLLRGLSLSGNALEGPVPAELGALAYLEYLYLGGNALTGALPRSLLRIGGLARFRFEQNAGLCAPGTPEFVAWLDGIGEPGGGPFCNEPDRTALTSLHVAAGGEGWTHSEGWLGDAALARWHGVETDSLGRVATLDLTGNGLAGRLPAGLGDLTAMTALRVGDNALSGRLPQALLRVSLRELDYAGTELCAPADEAFRAWLGGIAVLEDTGAECAPATDREILEMFHDATGGRDWIDSENWLTDSPLGEWRGVGVDEQGRVVGLWLRENALSGPIPPEIGDLTHLEYLRLSDNGLAGAIPPEIGDLPALEALRVENNDLSGPVPPGFGGLVNLRELGLTGNPRLAGPLPAELTSLGRLERLLAGDTGLCAPAEPGFAAWLERIPTRRIAPCAEEEAPAAYLVQAVQSRAFPVPLVAGKRALLRVFPTAARAAGAGVPAVRARFFVDGREAHVERIPGKPEAIPTGVDEGSLATSANAGIPAGVVRPGLEMVIEVDPDGMLDPALGIARRIPGTGRLAVDVRTVPPLELTVVPFLWATAPDSSILGVVVGLAADPEDHELLARARALLPVGTLDVTAHEPVLSSSNSTRRLLDETEAIRVMEGAGGHYMGMMAGPVAGPAGVAFVPGRASFSAPRPGTIAHELGHNMSLHHAPCGGAGDPDPSFPHPDGSVGAWGYDFARGELVRPTTPDLMSYCGPPDGISDYHFANALRYRLFDERGSAEAAVAAPATSLLLWGGTGANGAPFLNPAFVVDAPPALPDSAGAYTVTGRSARGTELFSLRFAMPRTADGDGGSGFAFALPAGLGWAGDLASITLAGPGGSFALNDDSDLPMAILRDPATGRVRGILREAPLPARAAMDAVERSPAPELEMLFSRGMPDAAAWRR